MLFCFIFPLFLCIFHFNTHYYFFMLKKQSSYRIKWKIFAVMAFICALFPFISFAHVKWFTGFSFLDKPLSVLEVLNHIYLGLATLSVIVISALVYIDRKIDESSWYRKIDLWLSTKAGYSLAVIRFAMAAILLIAWSNGTLLTPELVSAYDILIWMQFFTAVLLFFPRASAISGFALLLLYLSAVFEFGIFHMLDYLHFAGISIFIITFNSENDKIKGIGLPALYFTVGFSLIWLAYEKLYYPSWGLYLLEQNPQLALGLPKEFFLQAAAFVEISLGYLLIIGLLERPLAAVITLVFFTTTLVFGKLEVIGHTPLHAALIVFLFNGTGKTFKPPIAIHSNLWLRAAFAAINFIVILAVFLFAYSFSAYRQYEHALAAAQTEEGNVHGSRMMDLSNAEIIPEISIIEVMEDDIGEYILHVEIDNWTFTPEKTGSETVANEGHAHVYVNGAKAGRMYGNWFHLGELSPGQHTIAVILNGNDHTEFVVDGNRIGAETIVVVD